MDDQVTARTLVCAIPRAIVFCWLMTRIVELCRILTEIAVEFLKPGKGPEDTHGFERRVEELVRDLARSFEEWCFNSLEPPEVQSMPQQIVHFGLSYRRLRKKTPHANMLTRFGNITWTRTTYRQGNRGRRFHGDTGLGRLHEILLGDTASNHCTKATTPTDIGIILPIGLRDRLKAVSPRWSN